MNSPTTFKRYEELKHLLEGEPAESDAGLFGASLGFDEAQIVLIPVPWDATASYGKGASKGPRAILAASHQLDLVDPYFGKTFLSGIRLDDIPTQFPVVDTKDPYVVNRASERVNDFVYKRAKEILSANKFPAVLGGDHSSPFGLIKALGETHKNFGILHIDAHHDFRVAYEGYTHSHASIMYNALNEIPQINRLVAVGIRDFSRDEVEFAEGQKKVVTTFYDHQISDKLMEGESFASICKAIVSKLPDQVYVSFDIDGLDPSLCPGTGTPVPGGLSFQQFSYLMQYLHKSRKKIIGFDLCEVVPIKDDGEWNANVGARVLYKLCGLLASSQGLIGEA